MDPSTFPFKCQLADGTYVGGAWDNISALTIACAVFSVWQDYDPSTSGARQVSVLDDTDTVLAVVGRGS